MIDNSIIFQNQIVFCVLGNEYAIIYEQFHYLVFQENLYRVVFNIDFNEIYDI